MTFSLHFDSSHLNGHMYLLKKARWEIQFIYFKKLTRLIFLIENIPNNSLKKGKKLVIFQNVS